MTMTSRIGSVSAGVLLVSGLLAGCTPGPDPAVSGGYPVQATRTASLPADFPRARIPLVAGTVIAASGDAAHGWIVAVAPARGQGVAEATHLLAAAGYLTGALRPGPAQLAGSGYDVRLTVEGGAIVYAVKRT
jgi:hypothetical protein